MSYNVVLVHDEEGLRIDTGRSSFSQLPHGALTITGHEVPDGQVGVRTIGVALSEQPRQPLATVFSCGAHINVDRRHPEPEQPQAEPAVAE